MSYVSPPCPHPTDTETSCTDHAVHRHRLLDGDRLCIRRPHAVGQHEDHDASQLRVDPQHEHDIRPRAAGRGGLQRRQSRRGQGEGGAPRAGRLDVLSGEHTGRQRFDGVASGFVRMIPFGAAVHVVSLLFTPSLYVLVELHFGFAQGTRILDHARALFVSSPAFTPVVL